MFFLLNKLKNYSLILADSRYVIGVLLIHTPLFAYLNNKNLPQLNTQDLFYLEFFTLCVILFLVVMSFLLKFLFSKKKIFDNKNIFIYISIIYFLLFFWKQIKLFVPGFNYFIFQSGFIALILIILFPFIYFFILKNSYLKLLFNRFIFLYCFINLILFLYTFVSYNFDKGLIKIYNTNNTTEISESINNIKKPNIYYIILDSLLSMEKSKSINLINLERLNQIRNLENLKYIDKSFSNYNSSYLTIASIHYLNYMTTEKTPRYKSRFSYFPMMMSFNNNIPLINILDKNNYKYIWAGNSWAECRTSEKINCINNESLIPPAIKKYNSDTPFCQILNRLPIHNFFKCQNLLPPDIIMRTNIALEQFERPFFMFNHILLPHAPYDRDENCNFASFENSKNGEKLGFINGYNCALLQIINFIKYIEIKDPSGLVVIQGDHGFTFNNSISERASIFNAVKAPDRCIKEKELPKSNTNTIKFILNCALNLNLIFDENLHFISHDEGSSKYGFVTKYKVSEFK